MYVYFHHDTQEIQVCGFHSPFGEAMLTILN